MLTDERQQMTDSSQTDCFTPCCACMRARGIIKLSYYNSDTILHTSPCLLLLDEVKGTWEISEASS